MTGNQIRRKFLDFFRSKGHKIIASDSLVPQADPTLLFTGSGMNQFKDYFLGNKTDLKRAATSQKCLRTDDLDKVGKTGGHHTFFEMLGNFSFGDYFKEQAIQWAWEFLTRELKLPPDKLWVSVYKDDQEAYGIWQDKIGIPKQRIVKLGDKENFWPSEAPKKGPNGPCGPCSEIFYDQTRKVGCGKPTCSVACSCDRFVEVWNLVFTQFSRKDKGILEPLPNKNIDTGMGLERITAVMQGAKNNFDTDLFQPIIAHLEDIIRGKAKSAPNMAPPRLRAIADHIRAACFAIGDGVSPSNEGRGYVVRKLIRKAGGYGRFMHVREPFLYRFIPVVIGTMKEQYPELEESRAYITQVVRKEEERFQKILEEGMHMLTDTIKKLEKGKKKVLSGKEAFQLYDTFGFPLELTQEIARKKKISVDIKGFEREMDKQRKRARKASGISSDIFAQKEKGGSAPETKFSGYEKHEDKAKILKLIKNNKEVDKVEAEDKIQIILNQTSLYGESGGQVGDKGVINKENRARIEVYDTKTIDKVIVHMGKVIKGEFKVGDEVNMAFDRENRLSIARNHTATHLLHCALRKVLGRGVKQSGSLVDSRRLRFDFTHFEPVGSKALEQIERHVNGLIRQNDKVDITTMDLEKARAKGAIALFGEKYTKKVRVVSIGNYSEELCGGTHVHSTGEIGLFRIKGEGSVAAGIRRIEALTGNKAHESIKEDKERIEKSAADFTRKARNLELEKELFRKKLGELKLLVDEVIADGVKVNGINVITYSIEKAEKGLLRSMIDLIKEKVKKEAVITLGSVLDNKVLLVTAVTADLVKKGLRAGEIVKEVAKITGGGGGGRPDLAEAGGKNPGKLNEALKSTPQIIKAITKKQ